MRATADVRAVPHVLGRRIDLRWQNPPATDFAGGPQQVGVRIVRRERSFPLGPDDGDIVYDGAVKSDHADHGLAPLRTYYYTVFVRDGGAPAGFHHDAGSRAAAFATENYGLAERLYRLLPAVHLRLDAPLGPTEHAALRLVDPTAADALAALPPPLRDTGQLRRFMHATASPLDLMRSLAEGLRLLHDVGQARPEYLPLLAQWLGWDLDGTLPVFAQRNEIRHAPRLYRTVGTIPNLRAVVTRYTGWHVQVAEYSQSVARSNMAAQLNVFALAENAPGVWRATDDAADALGFGPGNDSATGTPGLPAALSGGAAEPFPLRSGMELVVTADERIPVVTRFHHADFLNISAATAAEIVAVLNRTLTEVTASAVLGGLELRSHTTGGGSRVTIERQAASLVTLEGAPGGRMPAFVDAQARIRLFYEATPAALGPPGGGECIRYKTLRHGVWGESISAATSPGATGQGRPAALELAGDRLFLAWVDGPGSADSRVRFRTGTPRLPGPATIRGQRSAPFRVPIGAHLLFDGSWPAPEGFLFAEGDFADPLQVSQADMVAVLNSRLTHVSAAAEPDGTISFSTASAGAEEVIRLDPGEASAAEAVGFTLTNASAAGDPGDAVDWDVPAEVTSAGSGRHDDLTATLGAGGDVHLFWVTHTGASWELVTSSWDGVTWSATSTLASGPGSHREPHAVRVPSGDLWLFWARQEPTSPEDNNWVLRRRVFDAVAATWGAEAPVTVTPPNGRAADREPAAALTPGGDIRVFFRSDRGGGSGLRSVDVAVPGGGAGAPAPVAAGPAVDRAPAPVIGPGDVPWLLFRSERSVPMSRVATRPSAVVEDRVVKAGPGVAAPALQPPSRRESVRLKDTGTMRRFAGTSSVAPADSARIGRIGQWDDPFCYTPQKPAGPPVEPALQDHERYDRGTLGLFLSEVIPESPLSVQILERLRPALRGFLPVNTRVVVRLAPRVDIELVYPPGADIGESYLDEHPDIEYYDGPADAFAAALPDWLLLRSNTLGDVSVDPANPLTVRRRTYFPPPL